MRQKKTVEHTALLVLALLSREDMYGYQMITRLEEQSDHTFEMKEGTLYPILHGLEKEGAVRAYLMEAPNGRQRKYYHLTEQGKELLQTEKAEWQAYSRAVNAVLSSALGTA